MKKLFCILIGHNWVLNCIGHTTRQGLLKCSRCKEYLLFELGECLK